MKLRGLLCTLIATLTLQSILCANVQGLITKLKTLHASEVKLFEVLKALRDGKAAEKPKHKAPKPGNGQQIFVKMLSGKTITLDISPDDTIAQMKQKIFDQEGIDIATQKLVCWGKVLDDNDTMRKSGFDRLHLVIRNPIKITLPPIEYQFLYKNSFKNYLDGKVNKFLSDQKVPDKDGDKIRDQANKIGIVVFGEEITKECGKYLSTEDKKAAAEKDPGYVAKNYFVPLCKEIINATIGEVQRSKVKDLLSRKALHSALMALTPSNIYARPTKDEESLIATQLKYVQNNEDVEQHPEMLDGFTNAYDRALERTLNLLEQWYKEETKPQASEKPTADEKPFEAARKLLGIDRFAPVSETPKEEVIFLAGLSKVVLLPRVEKLIAKASKDKKANDVKEFESLQKYIAEEQYVIDGVSIKQIQDKLDAIILASLKS